MDSGVTCYMRHDMKKIRNFRKLDVAEEIKLGVGYSVRNRKD